MSAQKQSNPTRAALTKAIGSKVGSMRLPELVRLASALKVTVPVVERSIHRRERTASRPVEHQGHVLQGSGIGPVVSAAEGGRLLDAITVDDESADWIESDLVGAGDLVDRLGISRGTLDNWRKAGKIVALRKGLRNFVYPLRQFERRGPVEGLDRVAQHFSSPEETWEWLVAPNRMTDGKAPIEALREGDVDGVISAAAGAFDYA